MGTNVHEPRIDRLLTIREVAETFGVSLTTVRRYVELGRLQPIRLVPNGRLRFKERAIREFIDAQREEET